MRFGGLRLGTEVVTGRDDELVAEARVEAARKNPDWVEVEEIDLVVRKPWLVHAESDELYSVFRGAIFERGSARLVFNYSVPLAFYVDRTGSVVFLERRPGTWSDVVAKRARRDAARS